MPSVFPSVSDLMVREKSLPLLLFPVRCCRPSVEEERKEEEGGGIRGVMGEGGKGERGSGCSDDFWGEERRRMLSIY